MDDAPPLMVASKYSQAWGKVGRGGTGWGRQRSGLGVGVDGAASAAAAAYLSS